MARGKPQGQCLNISPHLPACSEAWVPGVMCTSIWEGDRWGVRTYHLSTPSSPSPHSSPSTDPPNRDCGLWTFHYAPNPPTATPSLPKELAATVDLKACLCPIHAPNLSKASYSPSCHTHYFSALSSAGLYICCPIQLERLLPVSSPLRGILAGLTLMSTFMLSMSSSEAEAHPCPTPGAQFQFTLKRWGRDRRSLTLMDRPIRVAMLQCGMVGVKATATVLSGSLTWLKNEISEEGTPFLLVCCFRQIV